MVFVMKLIYPACFYKEENGYSVIVPDLKGCCTQGDTLEEAMEMAQDAALGWLLLALEDNEEIPQASDINNVELENSNGFKTLLLLDLSMYSQKYGNRKSIKKTLTIPIWLNESAEKYNINFSQTLQDALLKKIYLERTQKQNN